MNFLAAYEDLYSRFQPFSREASLLTYIAGEISEAVDTCSVDRFGNLIAHRSGRGKREDGQYRSLHVTMELSVPAVWDQACHEDSLRGDCSREP